jgi:uncharacterized protein (TIGR01777 family)
MEHDLSSEPAPRSVLVTGATGFVGGALAASLAAEGVAVLALSRSPRGAHQVRWDPVAGTIEAGRLEGVDAVVHLAGETIGQRWTPAVRERIRASRVEGTRLLATTLARLAQPPRVLVSASAVGIYGDRGEAVLDDGAAAGPGFLATLAQEWEAAARPAAEAGIRVVHPRMGLVLGAAGPPLARLVPLFRLGLGGPLGHGRQWMSWILLDDLLRVFRRMLVDPSVHGPVNTCAPGPVRNAEFAAALGRALGRPAFLPAPGFALRLVFGRAMVDEALLASQRVRPGRLEASGFRFTAPTIDEGVRRALATGGGHR